eukprot:1391055-Pleurochrysis_carterae.AAC.2
MIREFCRTAVRCARMCAGNVVELAANPGLFVCLARGNQIGGSHAICSRVETLRPWQLSSGG